MRIRDWRLAFPLRGALGVHVPCNWLPCSIPLRMSIVVLVGGASCSRAAVHNCILRFYRV